MRAESEATRGARQSAGKWRLFSSPLTRRILLVNLIAPIILAGGVLYLDHYKDGLIRSELAGLATQAQMVAAAVAEGAVSETYFSDGSEGLIQMSPELAQQMIRRLSESGQFRARLYDRDGQLAADSRILLSYRGNIQIEDLPPPRGAGIQGVLGEIWEFLTTWMPRDTELLPYQEFTEDHAERWPEAMAAMAGQTQGMVRAGRERGIILSVAVPVQRLKQVVGALVVSHDGRAVAASLFQVRVAIFQTFLVSLAVTIMLSLIIAGTIARPVRRLALAADKVRRGMGRRVQIPDFSRRRDEIGELSVALKDMTEALWARMDAIERFAADVSHEIKNPLTSVRSAVETAARLDDPEKQKKLLAIIKDDVERLNRLITDISDASRVDAEMSRADNDSVSLADMLLAMGEIYNSTDDEDAVRLAVEVPHNDPLWVLGVESRLVQVIRNLIGNAISFSPAKGVIRLKGLRQGDKILIQVEDQGPGIPENKLLNIFERFYSERPSSEKFGTHSGLGLSISKQIISGHGGSIWAENIRKDNQVVGARFSVLLQALD